MIMLTVPRTVRENPERGIDAVLKMPFTGFDLTTLVRKVGETRAMESANARSLVVSLFSPKGGVGRTTLAYNIAVALGREHRVCLVDGSLQFSDLRGVLRVPAVAPSIVNLPTDKIREQDLGEVMGATRRDRHPPRPASRRDGRDGDDPRRRRSSRCCGSSTSSSSSTLAPR